MHQDSIRSPPPCALRAPQGNSALDVAQALSKVQPPAVVHSKRPTRSDKLALRTLSRYASASSTLSWRYGPCSESATCVTRICVPPDGAPSETLPVDGSGAGGIADCMAIGGEAVIDAGGAMIGIICVGGCCSSGTTPMVAPPGDCGSPPVVSTGSCAGICGSPELPIPIAPDGAIGHAGAGAVGSITERVNSTTSTLKRAPC